MKILSFGLLIGLSLFTMISCGSDDGVEPPAIAELNFTTTSASLAEDGMMLTLTISADPMIESQGTVDVAIMNGAGAAYGVDYTTDPNGSSGSFSLSFAAGATSTSIRIMPLEVLGTNGDRMVTFELTNPTGGVSLGELSTSVITITD